MERKAEIKPPVEVRYQKELEALQALDTGKSLRTGNCRQKQCGHLSWAAKSQ